MDFEKSQKIRSILIATNAQQEFKPSQFSHQSLIRFLLVLFKMLSSFRKYF